MQTVRIISIKFTSTYYWVGMLKIFFEAMKISVNMKRGTNGLPQQKKHFYYYNHGQWTPSVLNVSVSVPFCKSTFPDLVLLR